MHSDVGSRFTSSHTIRVAYGILRAKKRNLHFSCCREELANLRSREKIWEEQFQDWRHTEEKLKIKVNTLEQELSSRNHDLQHYKEMSATPFVPLPPVQSCLVGPIVF